MPERSKDLVAVSAHGRHPYVGALPTAAAAATQVASPSKSPVRAKDRPPTSASGLAARRRPSARTSAAKTTDESPEHDHALVERRLLRARTTRKLDLSTSQHHVPAEVAFQLFPRQVVTHVHMGHQLTELWLTNHHIAALPPEIALFTSLRVLGLGGNMLSSLPDAISALTSLEALYLERNRFRAIPATVVLPFHLRDLRLDGNQLAVFPTAVTKLRLLNHLGLSRNQIRAVSPEIQRLRNLVELDLDYNALGPTLPHEMTALTKLVRLGLDGNHFAVGIEEWTVTHLPALEYLRINRNRPAVSAAKSQDDTDDPNQETSGVDAHEGTGGVPRRHDGYFQCTKSYRHSDTPDADLDDDVRSHGNSATNQVEGLRGLVPCRDRNLLNAELDRSELARNLHRKI